MSIHLLCMQLPTVEMMLFSLQSLGLLLSLSIAICNEANSVDDGLGDIPAEILNLLLSPGIQISQMNISLTVSFGLINYFVASVMESF